MANLFSVGDSVVCQKLGGQSGNKPLSPAFPGTVLEVKPGGNEYVVGMRRTNRAHTPMVVFRNGVVEEQYMTAA